MISTELVERARSALDVALPRALGATLIDAEDPTAGVRFRVGDLGATPFGTLHAAALAAIVELAGYLVVLPTLEASEHAVTHAISTQYLRPARAGEQVEVVAALDKRARTLAFVSVVSTVHAADDARVVARTQITKTIVGVS